MKCRVVLLLGLFVCFMLPPKQSVAQADPVTAAIKAAVIKVIKAIDLKIQRLQNNTIWLQNIQKTAENTMAKLKLKEISDWVEKQRKLYDDYFQELWKVKQVISTYHRVKEIVALQTRIVDEYQHAYALFRGDKNFTADEIEYMYYVYSGILDESLKNLDQVYLVINSFATQMDDAKRIEIINTAHDHLQENFNDLDEFNNQNKFLSIQRAADKAEVIRLKAYYGLQ